MGANLNRLLILGAIADLPQDDQEKIRECHQKLKAVVEEYGDCGCIALSLLGTELASE